MVNFKYKVKSQNGIHARPAKVLVDLVKKYDNCKIEICRCGNGALNFSDASQIFSVMKLGVKEGDEVVFRITGPNESTENDVKNKFFNSLAKSII